MRAYPYVVIENLIQLSYPIGRYWCLLILTLLLRI